MSTESLQEQALLLYLKGATIVDIAKKVNRSRPTIYNWAAQGKPESKCHGRTWEELLRQRQEAATKTESVKDAIETVSKSRNSLHSILEDMPLILREITDKIKDGSARVSSGDYTRLMELYLKIMAHDDEKNEFVSWFATNIIQIIMEEVTDTSARARIKARIEALQGEAELRIGEPLIKSAVN